jgi:hypothetical protein
MDIVPVLHKAPLKSFDEKMDDLKYWLAQPLVKRLEAVTFVRLPKFKPFGFRDYFLT